MNSITSLTERILKFRDARDWKQFHKPKDVALSLMLEAAELGEHFQWKNEKEVLEYIPQAREEIGDELADVLYWVLLLSHDLRIDLEKAFIRKMRKNEKKYPIKTAKGQHTKYTVLGKAHARRRPGARKARTA